MLSLGSVGCNFTCRHCQNWQIAHADPLEATRDLRELPVRNLPVLADHNDCRGVAWTYNEPTIWLEYILDGAQVAHEHGLYTVMVTNGYITEEALDVLAPHIDAYRVDVKGFSDAAVPRAVPHRRHLARPGAAVRAKREHGCHVEIVTNVIPTFNDDDETLSGIAAWMVAELGPETPWHVTRFMPYLEMAHLPRHRSPRSSAPCASGTRQACSSSTSATSRGTRARTRCARTAGGCSCGARGPRLRMSP